MLYVSVTAHKAEKKVSRCQVMKNDIWQVFLFCNKLLYNSFYVSNKS